MAEFVPYDQRETYQLHNIPPAQLRNIRRRSHQRNTSYADVVAQILANRFDVGFVPSTRRRPATAAYSTSLSVRVPPEVMNQIRTEAGLEGITIRSTILNILSDAFGLKRPIPTHVLPESRPGRRKET